jgi:hypothetical protein
MWFSRVYGHHLVAGAGATLTRGCFGVQHKLDSATRVELDGFLQINAVQSYGAPATVGDRVMQLAILNPVVHESVHPTVVQLQKRYRLLVLRFVSGRRIVSRGIFRAASAFA